MIPKHVVLVLRKSTYRPIFAVKGGGNSHFPVHSHLPILGDPKMFHDHDIQLTRSAARVVTNGSETVIEYGPQYDAQYVKRYGPTPRFDEWFSRVGGNMAIDSAPVQSALKPHDDDDEESNVYDDRDILNKGFGQESGFGQGFGSTFGQTFSFAVPDQVTNPIDDDDESVASSQHNDNSIDTASACGELNSEKVNVTCELSYGTAPTDPFLVTDDDEDDWARFEAAYDYWALLSHAEIESRLLCKNHNVPQVSGLPGFPIGSAPLNCTSPCLSSESDSSIPDATMFFDETSSYYSDPKPTFDDELLAMLNNLSFDDSMSSSVQTVTAAEKIDIIRSSCNRCYALYRSDLKVPCRFNAEHCQLFRTPPHSSSNPQTTLLSCIHTANPNHVCSYCLGNGACYDAIHDNQGLFQMVMGSYSAIFTKANCKFLLYCLN